MLPSAPKFIPVFWHPPPFGWVKVNTHGSFKSGDRVGIGGVFRDHSGVPIEAFASHSYFASSIAAEILAVIEAIRIAWVRDWNNVWLETDSALVVHLLNLTTMVVPWFFAGGLGELLMAD